MQVDLCRSTHLLQSGLIRTAILQDDRPNLFIQYFVDPCNSLQILVNNQYDALCHVFIYTFQLSACFEHQVLIIVFPLLHC